jgi:hypothetical protein
MHRWQAAPLPSVEWNSSLLAGNGGTVSPVVGLDEALASLAVRLHRRNVALAAFSLEAFVFTASLLQAAFPG